MTTLPLYLRLKQFIKDGIRDGTWLVNSKIPSENQLASHFSVSRMTANRAVKELTAEGVLKRVHGLGTFVAEQKAEASLMEIQNIADEIRNRGHHYSNKVIKLEQLEVSPELEQSLGIQQGTQLFFSMIIHYENHIPIQLELRYVNPQIAPHYIEQDFSTYTPNEYLSQIAPLSAAEHSVEAIVPDQQTRLYLEINEQTPCLLLWRKTWSQQVLATVTKLLYPGNRYRLCSYFEKEK